MSNNKQWIVSTALGVITGVLWMLGLQAYVVVFVVIAVVKIWYRLDIK